MVFLDGKAGHREETVVRNTRKALAVAIVLAALSEHKGKFGSIGLSRRLRVSLPDTRH